METATIVIIGVVVLAILFMTGAPIYVGLSSSGIVMLLLIGMSLSMGPLTVISALDSFTLLACPFFIIAGDIMAKGGCSPYLFGIVNTFLGRIRGGIAFTTVVVCVIYGAICGSTTATLAGVTAVCMPNMMDAGYSRKFSAGLIASSATLGQIIPPSLFMIVYSSMVNEDVGRLFLSGILPGLLAAASLCVVAFFKSPHVSEMTINTDPAYYSWSNRGKVFMQGLPALLMPVIILGSIYGGIVTPTEAAAVACFYGIFVCMFVYRSMSFKGLVKTIIGCANTHACTFTMIAGSYVFALALTLMEIPQNVSRWVVSMGFEGTPLIIGVAAVYLVLGCFMDCMPILILVVPIVYPALLAGGVDLVHFNVVTIIAMQIGQITPPFGTSLFLTSKMAETPVEDIVREVVPYIGALSVVLVICIFFPQISLFLPSLGA